MIKLSDRLKSIADEIKKGETVADIGTDHGFLPVYLWENHISPHVIMTDISPASLKKAEDNCQTEYPGIKFDLRTGDGLEPVRPAETDAVVMAGMGGLLMSEILGKNPPKSRSFGKIILQPRNHSGELRYWLYNNGFSIVKEKLVREGRFICEIITAVPKEVAVIRSMGPERIEYQYPHSMIRFAGPLTREYLESKLNMEKEILAGMERGREPDPRQIRSQSYRIEYIERLIKQL